MTPSSGPLPPGDINIKYPPVTFSASGCNGPFTYSLNMDPFMPNPLPTGLDFNSSTRTLSGTPGQVGSKSFSITADGPNLITVTNDYTLVINPLPTITTASPLPAAPIGALYSQQIAATGGTPGASGYIFSMNNNPPGLTISQKGLLSGTPTQTGTFSFNISVTDSLGGQTVSPFQVSFVSGTPQIQVSPLSLTFNADSGGNPPPTQSLSVVPGANTNPPVNFHISIDNGQDNTAAPSWISVSPSSGSTPAGLVVSVDQGSLASGAYPARIHVLDSNNLPTDVSVTLNVAAAPQHLSVSPSMLRFGARSAAPGIVVQDLVVSNTGTGTLSFNTSVTNGSSWLSAITPNSGQTTRVNPVYLQVQVNTAGLKIGSYNDTIHITSPAGNADIPVSVFVSAGGPVLSITPPGFFFHARQNAGSSASDTVEILNLGDPNSTVHWTATLVSGSDWLTLGATSGTATTSNPGILSMTLVQNATARAVGPYYALLKVEDPNALNSPQYMTAILSINADSVPPTPDATPGGLFFTTPAGGAAPPSQQVVVNTSNATPISFQVATTTNDGSTWLHATPSSGNASGQTPGHVAVSVDPTGLAAGIYTGNVSVSIGQTLESVNITFVVQPTGGSSRSLETPSAKCRAPPANLRSPRMAW